MANFLDYLKECKDCLYIYDLSLEVFGISQNKKFYVVVVANNWFPPEEWIGFYDGDFVINDEKFSVYKIDDWFNMVLNGDILCWECACLNKKFVIKEHVKLLMQTNPLQLRKQIDKHRSTLSFDILNCWNFIKDLNFANQIIDNHKIVNFKDSAKAYQKLVNSVDLIATFNGLIDEPYKRLRQCTDAVLMQSKINKILQNE